MLNILNCRPLPCAIPLYPNKWNVWQLVRAFDPQSTTRDQIEAEVRQLMGRDAAQQIGLDWPTWLPNADASHLGVHTFIGNPELPNDFTDQAALAKAERDISEKFQASSSPVLSADISNCPGGVTLEEPAFTRILVQFVWRGKETEMSWPAARKVVLPTIPDPLGSIVLPDELWRNCGNDATYVLTEVYAPGQGSDAPKTWSESLAEDFSNGVKKLGEGVKGAKDDFLAVQVIGIALGVVFLAAVMRH